MDRKRLVVLAAGLVTLAVSLGGCGETDESTPSAGGRDVATEEVDTGRMSESEYAAFEQAHLELLEKSSAFADGMQACSQIGLSGDLAGFRTCLQDSYSGVEEDASFAEYVADDRLDDVSGACENALRQYLSVTQSFNDVVSRAYDVANRLEFDSFGAAFDDLGPAAKEWGDAGTTAQTTCRPE